MTREQARSQINARLLTDYADLKASTSGQYICPICGSGTGAHKTGALHIYKDKRRAVCFSCPEGEGLGKPGQDTLGALRVIWGCSEAEVFARVGIQIDRQESSVRSMPMRSEQNQAVTAQPIRPAQDFSEYYARCRERLREPAAISYLQARGISLETAEAYNIGYDAEADAACSGHKSRRIILPTSPAHYVARAIDSSVQPAYQKMNNKGGKPSIFNLGAIYAGADAVFVVEGHFDALSILEIGAQAIALCSANNTELLVKALERKRTESTLILCLDDDAAGKKASERLETDLKRLNISYVIGDVTNGHKDCNEALCADRTAFTEAVNAERLQIAKPDAVSLYISRFMGDDLDAFTEARDRKTGFTALDNKMRGLFAGLYVIGAISSLGKTTLSLQIADQLAESGEDVLFFSLEQSRLELVSKSIARTAAQIDITNEVDSLSLRRGYWNTAARQALDVYSQKVGDRLSIIEGNFSCSVSFIGEYIRRYIRRTGRKPVVFVDYLQILQPEKDERGRTQSARETVDHTVTELKRISREHGLTVFVISSFNRSNYLTPVDFESFKESGGIEYSADVLIGLQLQCMNDEIFSKKEEVKKKRDKVKAAKAASPRKIELVCLKNRYGVANFSCYFDYYPRNDLFVEDDAANKEYDDQREAVREITRKITNRR